MSGMIPRCKWRVRRCSGGDVQVGNTTLKSSWSMLESRAQLRLEEVRPVQGHELSMGRPRAFVDIGWGGVE